MIPDSPNPRNGADDGPRVTLRLFASARVAAGTDRVEMVGRTVGSVLAGAAARWGQPFASVVTGSRVWVNGQPADADCELGAGDEVAVIPPVSGGAR